MIATVPVTPELTPPDLEKAADFLAALGRAFAEFTFQTFSDHKPKPLPAGWVDPLARVFHGTLAEHGAELSRLNAAGAGVFVTVNETDLHRRNAASILAPRALFVDFDGPDSPLALQPSAVVQSGGGKHAYWFLRRGEDLGRFTPAQKQLAAFYNSDPRIHDKPRVMRLPGFDWRKDPVNPFRVELLAVDAALEYSLDQILAAHPVAAPEPAPSRPRTSSPSADVSRRIQRAIAYLEQMPPGVSGQDGSGATFRAAVAVVRGFDLEPGIAFDVLSGFNDRCEPPWSEKELLHKIKNADEDGTVPRGYLLTDDRPTRTARPRSLVAVAAIPVAAALSSTALPPAPPETIPLTTDQGLVIEATAALHAGRHHDEILPIAAGIRNEIERDRFLSTLAHDRAISKQSVRKEVGRLRRTLRAVPPPDDWRANLVWKTLTDGSQKLEPCISNAVGMLRWHEQWAGKIRFNELTLQAECAADAPIDAPEGPWSDRHTIETTVWLQTQASLKVPVPLVPDAVLVAAHATPFHPVRQYLDGLAWDGVERLNLWLEDLAGVERSSYSEAVGRRWLISAVARIYSPGCQADHILILEGRQGVGKSRLLRTLADPWFGDELDVMGSKDAAMQTRGVWLVEIAELDSLRHSDLSKTKAFVTRSVDRFRPPYGRFVEEHPRGCVFAGSVNDSQYLRDESGNRRFWPVRCAEIDLQAARASRDQLWAEAVVAYRAGEPWWLNREKETTEAEAEQESRYQEDSWEEQIATALETWTPGVEVTVAAVLKAIHVDTPKQDRTAQMRTSACLKRLGLECRQVRVAGQKLRTWTPKEAR